MDLLRNLEKEAEGWSPADMNDAKSVEVGNTLKAIGLQVLKLQLRSSEKQMRAMLERVQAGDVTTVEFSRIIRELRVRIEEDLEDRVFYCITDGSKIDRFFKRDDQHVAYLRPKPIDDVFDKVIIGRFPDCIDDLEAVRACYIVSVYTSCVFHLMRVVEHGLMEVAKLAAIEDPKPSWGAVLGKVDLYAFRTEYKDLPDGVKPHRELLKELSPEMHAIQYAWRNRVSHVENKLIPVKPIDHPIATEIMSAVQAFMRSLAERLPPIEK